MHIAGYVVKNTVAAVYVADFVHIKRRFVHMRNIKQHGDVKRSANLL